MRAIQWTVDTALGAQDANALILPEEPAAQLLHGNPAADAAGR
ncbi:hypothetical protein [Embleya sp. NPDC005971]